MQQVTQQDSSGSGTALFARDGIEYRRVGGTEDVYEYNRLSDPSAVRFSDGGIADGYVTLHADGTPVAPAISYVVLDQYIKRDAPFLSEISGVPLAARDYEYYRSAEQALRALQRVLVSPDGRSVTVISGGRKAQVELVPPYMVVDRSYRQFFSLVDVRAGTRLFADVELKVDVKNHRVVLVDRRGSGMVLAELPYTRLGDTESGEIFEPDRRVDEGTNRVSLSSGQQPGSKVSGSTLSTLSSRAIAPGAVRAGASSPRPEIRNGPVGPAASSARPLSRAVGTTLDAGSVAKDGSVLGRSSFLRFIAPHQAEANSIPSRDGVELGGGREETTPSVPAVSREGAPRLISETRREESTERIFELPRSKVRFVLSYQGDGSVVPVSVAAGMSLYPGNTVLPDWEQRISRARERWKKFRYDDVEQDIAAAKRIVVARARELLAYAAAAAAFAPLSSEAKALEEARLKLKADTEARYGKVFK